MAARSCNAFDRSSAVVAGSAMRRPSSEGSVAAHAEHVQSNIDKMIDRVSQRRREVRRWLIITSRRRETWAFNRELPGLRTGADSVQPMMGAFYASGESCEMRLRKFRLA